jgi:hypothetical protein
MPSKTERIISYLPSTFSAFPKPSALYSFVDAFGNELLLAENSLAALMSAHWVDFADRNAELLNDLACMARLYGLAPRGAPQRPACGPLSSAESVEEFRDHLKRYVRTYLEGTVTVQGILRVVAEVLGLQIADDYKELDAWWTRRDDGLTTIEPRGDDAARNVFGVESAIVNGEPTRPAFFNGNIDLSGGVNLSGASVLHLKIDDDAPVEIDLAAKLSKTAGVTLDEIKEAINTTLGASIATHDGRFLRLSSKTIGPASQFEIFDTHDDAAPRLLGLAPHLYHGIQPAHARITGRVDLSDGVDLSEERYLRLLVDEKFLGEVDCAGADATHTKLDEIVQAINQAFSFPLASHDGHFLQLTSPSSGFGSSIFFEEPAAQDARERLFGQVGSAVSGDNGRPAEVVGTSDLSSAVDLSLRSKLRIRLDGQPAIIVDCAGNDPEHTRLDEITIALNARLGAGLASHDRRFVHLQSPTIGPESSISFESLPPDVDATEIIFGIRPRTARGFAATHARLVGKNDLSHGLDAAALETIRIGLNAGPAVELNLRRGAANERAVTLEELRVNINRALGADVASHDDQHLILTSPEAGSASRIELAPLLVTRRRRFVTRAFIKDEAAQAVFGFVTREAHGEAETRAVVQGKTDLSRAVDLREANFLRLTVDDWPAVDIDCGGVRPRATMLEEVIEKINGRLAQLDDKLKNVASASLDAQNLLLSSPTLGSGSRIAFSPPRAIDALDALLGLEPHSFFGRDATRVLFVGTVDLSGGVNLSAAQSIKLRIDDREPVEIKCASQSDPSQTLLGDIISAINKAVGATVAQDDGAHVLLSSLTTGENSRIEFIKPDAPDATTAIFGITPTRIYRGNKSTPAHVSGTKDLHEGADLRVGHFLNIAVDGGEAVTIDCAARATDAEHTSLDNIVQEINVTLKLAVASHDGKHLLLTSPTLGAKSQIELLASTGNDAKEKLLGDVDQETKGIAPAPAIIEGTAELVAPLDLSERHIIRLSVDRARPLDVDIAGSSPGKTTPDEIIERINTIFPKMASKNAKNHLLLTSATRGVDSLLSLLPVRALELIEYPPAEATDPVPSDSISPVTTEASTVPSRKLRHGDSWAVNNNGVSDAEVEITLSAPQGTVGPEFVNRSTGQRIKLLSVIRPGEQARIWCDPEGHVQAMIISSEGESRTVPPEQIVAGPLGAQAQVPFEAEQNLKDGTKENAAALQLNNPLAKTLILLRARKPGIEGNSIKVSVTEAKPVAHNVETNAAPGNISKLTGRVRGDKAGFRLVDAEEQTLAHLRAGPGVVFNLHLGRVVALQGRLHPTDEAGPLMIVEQIDDLFDVTLRFESPEGVESHQSFPNVLIGTDEEARDGIVWQINHEQTVSTLVHAEVMDKLAALLLPRGRVHWAYYDCFGTRFNFSQFDSRFAGDHCIDRAVFNLSRFSSSLPGAETSVLATAKEAAVFASANIPDPPVEVRFRWMEHQPGAFIVNLPLDLPENFGARFNDTRFGMAGDELFESVFTEPGPDKNPDHLVTRINKGPKKVKGQDTPGGSTLLGAEIVESVPSGFEVINVPFRKPRKLTGGTESEAARIYLAEKDVNGFIKLSARTDGAWGNSISVAARKAGPARFDVTVSYAGALFENARQTAHGGEQLPTLTEEILQPGPAGVLQAKAAGVKTQVSRDRA